LQRSSTKSEEQFGQYRDRSIDLLAPAGRGDAGSFAGPGLETVIGRVMADNLSPRSKKKESLARLSF